MAGNHSAVKIHTDHVVKKPSSRNGEMVTLNGVGMGTHKNELICAVGPFGCGKSILFNIIDGPGTPTGGKVLVDGAEVTSPSPDHSIIFQQYALSPWLTMKENVQSGLRLQGKSKEEVEELTHKYLKMVDLEDFAKACPRKLSGGMKQRVAVARAYTVNPRVLLMNEPSGALNAQARTQLQRELLNTWEKEQKTCFFIIYDIEKTIILAQRVVIMYARPNHIEKIVDIDTPCPRGQEAKMSPRFLELKNHVWSQIYQKYLSVHK